MIWIIQEEQLEHLRMLVGPEASTMLWLWLACALHEVKLAQEAEAQGDYASAYEHYQALEQRHPDESRYHTQAEHLRLLAAQQRLQEANTAVEHLAIEEGLRQATAALNWATAQELEGALERTQAHIVEALQTTSQQRQARGNCVSVFQRWEALGTGPLMTGVLAPEALKAQQLQAVMACKKQWIPILIENMDYEKAMYLLVFLDQKYPEDNYAKEITSLQSVAFQTLTERARQSAVPEALNDLDRAFLLAPRLQLAANDPLPSVLASKIGVLLQTEGLGSAYPLAAHLKRLFPDHPDAIAALQTCEDRLSQDALNLLMAGRLTDATTLFDFARPLDPQVPTLESQARNTATQRLLLQVPSQSTENAWLLLRQAQQIHGEAPEALWTQAIQFMQKQAMDLAQKGQFPEALSLISKLRQAFPSYQNLLLESQQRIERAWATDLQHQAQAAAQQSNFASAFMLATRAANLGRSSQDILLKEQYRARFLEHNAIPIGLSLTGNWGPRSQEALMQGLQGPAVRFRPGMGVLSGTLHYQTGCKTLQTEAEAAVYHYLGTPQPVPNPERIRVAQNLQTAQADLVAAQQHSQQAKDSLQQAIDNQEIARQNLVLAQQAVADAHAALAPLLVEINALKEKIEQLPTPPANAPADPNAPPPGALLKEKLAAKQQASEPFRQALAQAKLAVQAATQQKQQAEAAVVNASQAHQAAIQESAALAQRITQLKNQLNLLPISIMVRPEKTWDYTIDHVERRCWVDIRPSLLPNPPPWHVEVSEASVSVDGNSSIGLESRRPVFGPDSEKLSKIDALLAPQLAAWATQNLEILQEQRIAQARQAPTAEAATTAYLIAWWLRPNQPPDGLSLFLEQQWGLQMRDLAFPG